MYMIHFNAEKARAAIRSAIAGLKDATPLFERITELLIRSTKERFVRGVAPDGTAWAPKKAATLERYRRMGYGNRDKPLHFQGILSRLVIGVAQRNGALIGSNQVYANVMQKGASKGAFGQDSKGRSIPWGPIPARVWLGMSREDDEAVAAETEEYIEGHLNGR